MESNGAFQPPPCTEAGKRCNECWNGDNSECGFQKLGQRALEQTLRIIVLEEDKEKSQIELVKRDERLELLSHDSKTGFLTLEGLDLHLQSAEFAEQQTGEGLGVLSFDMRFLTVANSINHEVGDSLIELFSDTLRSLLRTTPGSIEDRRDNSSPEVQRRDGSPDIDIIFFRRGKGDEFGAIISNITTKDFTALVQRLRDTLGSLDKVMKSSTTGAAPVQASVGGHHISLTDENWRNLKDEIGSARSESDQDESLDKQRQYEEYIGAIVESDPESFRVEDFWDEKTGKLDTRKTATALISRFFPAFAQDPASAIEKSRLELQS